MVKVIYLKYPEPRSFPSLPATTVRCVGSGNYLTELERFSLKLNRVVLIHDKNNRHDENAVAVLDVEGRCLGYVSAAKGKTYAPLLDQIGALKVACKVERKNSNTIPILWLDLPKAAALSNALAK